MPRSRGAQHPLRETVRPAFGAGRNPFRLVDLFCGCGGLSLGVAQASQAEGRAFKVALAVDLDDDAAMVYEANFPGAKVTRTGAENLFDGGIGGGASANETRLLRRTGTVHALVGGPPCQGHSDLNNYTRRDDPKNLLYLTMVRAAELLRPAVVMIENVPMVRKAKANVVQYATKYLEYLGYNVADWIVPAELLGVAQLRRRHTLLAIRDGLVDPDDVFEAVLTRGNAVHTLRWAIGDLAAINGPRGLDIPPRASEANRRRMQWLLDHDRYDLPNRYRPPCHQDNHSYKSMYGRLRWTRPAQTITSGFGSVGQGRYMHPDQPRALTPHEAARIQGFPDYFDFSAIQRRASLAVMIGNAVPPALSASIFSILFESMNDDEWEPPDELD